MDIFCRNQLQRPIHNPWIWELLASGNTYIPDFPLLEHVMFNWLPIWFDCNNNTFMHSKIMDKSNDINKINQIKCHTGIRLNHARTEFKT
jgi:hypothetical protein